MDKLGDTPLHVACRYGDAALGVARTIFAAAPSYGPTLAGAAKLSPVRFGSSTRSILSQKWLLMARNGDGNTVLDEVCVALPLYGGR